MEAPTAAKMEAGVRGSGAEAAGSCSLAVSPLSRLVGETRTTSPGGRGEGVVARSFV